MSVPVTEHPASTDTMRSFNEKSTYNPEQKEELLGSGRRKPYVPEKLRHTAEGLEALGFNESASMYRHGYRHYSIDSAKSEPEEGKERKRRVSFIKKLIGGGNGSVPKEKGEKA